MSRLMGDYKRFNSFPICVLDFSYTHYQLFLRNQCDVFLTRVPVYPSAINNDGSTINGRYTWRAAGVPGRGADRI